MWHQHRFSNNLVIIITTISMGINFKTWGLFKYTECAIVIDIKAEH